MTTDTRLLERWIEARDASAFRELVSRHAAWVHGACRRVLGSDADAEDAAQRCFVQLARSSCPPRSSLAAWLHTVAVRASLDQMRGERRRARHERRFADERASAASIAERDRAELDELQAEVDACLLELPEILRGPIVAHFLEGRTQDDIAREVGTSRQTISHRIGKGVRKLRERLARRGVDRDLSTLAAALPALAGGTAPATLVATLGRLALGGAPSAPAAALSVSTTPSIGAILMTQKILVSAAIAMVLLIVCVVMLESRSREPALSGSEPGATDDSASRTRDERALATPDASSTDSRSATPAERGRSPQSVVADAVLSGVVLDATGVAVRDARVALVRVGADATGTTVEALARVRGEPDGHFSVPRPPAGFACALVALSSDGCIVERLEPESTEVRLTLSPLCAIGGVVYDRGSGTPIEGISLVLRCEERSFPISRVFPEIAENGSVCSTDREGHFLFRAAGPLRAQIAFRPHDSHFVLPGMRRGDLPGSIELAPGEERTQLDFGLDAGGAIGGVVFGPDLLALAGAAVELVPSFPSPLRPRQISDEHGRFRFGALPTGASYTIAAWSDGLAAGFSEPLALPEAIEVNPVEVHLGSGLRVSGKVLGEAGPLAAARVQVLRRFESRTLPVGGHETLETGEDGGFESKPLSTGEYLLHASADGYRGASVSVRIEGDSGDPLLIQLERPARGFIAGVVLDDRGEPAQARVVVRRGGRRVASGSSAEDGTFRIEGIEAEDEHIVTAMSKDHWGERLSGIARDTEGLVVRVVRRGRIRARVTDLATGAPIGELEARAIFERPDGNRFHTSWISYANLDGQVIVDGAEPRPVTTALEVRAPGFLPARSAAFLVPPGDETAWIPVVLRRGLRLDGVVRDATSGAPLAGVYVRAHDREDFGPELLDAERDDWRGGGVWSLTMTDAEGRFAVDGIRAEDSPSLVLWRRGYSTALRRDLQLDSISQPIQIELRAESGLRVQLRSSRGSGDTFSVDLEHRDARPWRSAWRATHAIRRGETQALDALPSGAFRLVVWRVVSDGGARQRLGEMTLDLAEGVVRELTVDLDVLVTRHGRIEGRVKGPRASDALELSIRSVSDPEERFLERSPELDEDGRFTVPGLPPGEYLVVARERGGSVRETSPVSARVEAAGVTRVVISPMPANP